MSLVHFLSCVHARFVPTACRYGTCLQYAPSCVSTSPRSGLFVSIPTPYPVRSLVSRCRPVLSLFYPHVQRSFENTRKKRRLWTPYERCLLSLSTNRFAKYATVTSKILCHFCWQSVVTDFIFFCSNRESTPTMDYLMEIWKHFRSCPICPIIVNNLTGVDCK